MGVLYRRIAVAFGCAMRLERGEPLQTQVAAIGAGMAALVAGDVLYWLYESVLEIQPYQSAADAFYVASFPVLGGGLLVALRAFTRGQKQAGPVAAGQASPWLRRPPYGRRCSHPCSLMRR